NYTNPVPVYLSFFTHLLFFLIKIARHPRSTLFPYTTLFRSLDSSGSQQTASSELLKPMILISSGTESPFCLAYFTAPTASPSSRSEEHTSELQSRFDLVCRLLLEKKKILILLLTIHIPYIGH